MTDLLTAISNVCKSLDIDWVIIGGLALPAYGITRTTLDLDLAINPKTNEKLQLLISKLDEISIKTVQKPKITHLVFTVFSTKFLDEAEIWLQPCDAFTWDNEMIERILTVSGDIDVNVLSPEDFVMTKLARMDRSGTDLQDIIQVILSVTNLDWNYLIKRAKNFGFFIDLQELAKRIIKNDSDALIPDRIFDSE